VSNFFAKVRFQAERANLKINPADFLVCKELLIHDAARV